MDRVKHSINARCHCLSMTTVCRSLVLLLLFVGAGAAAQQGTKPRTRIICKPPALKVLKMVRPTFPLDAKAKDMFGTVAVEVAIDKKGLPSSVKILKGDPVLAAAVVEAVKKWRWKPLELNGEAVEVTTTIIVTLEPR